MTAERLYSALLYLYPAQFRREYGDAMLEAFRAARRDMTPVRFWPFIAVDVIRSLCTEHVRDLSPDTKRVAHCAAAGVLSSALLAGSITVVVAAAGRSVHAITDEVRATPIQTGWVAAADPGQTKVVPFIIVTIENVSSELIRGLHLTAIFRSNDDARGWGEVYVARISGDRLAPRTASAPLLLKSPLGYTGVEPMAQLLRHPQFVDVRVALFATRGPAQWQRLGEWPVQRLVEPR